MHSPRAVWAALFSAAMVLAPTARAAADSSAAGVVFQRPNRGGAPSASTAGTAQFRPASSAATVAPNPAPVVTAPAAAPAVTTDNPLRTATVTRLVTTSATRPSATTTQPAAKPIASAPRPAASTPSFAQPGQSQRGTGAATPRSRAIAAASIQPWIEEPGLGSSVRQASYGGGYCDCGEPTCGICEPACGCAEPGCGICEAACGIAEPGCGLEPACGCAEPGCSICEPGCGIIEPDCGIVGCGSCVGNPGPDYWCFPVCLPRFKDLRFWGGVHGFKGPRDSPDFGGAGDGNFGFQEGFNLGGRAPLLSLAFPQLSYQLGYQAVQSQLSGLSDGTSDDRSQQFVTGGFFRRVHSGLQFGVVWDMLRDDFQVEEDFHQLRYELSFKSATGHEFGFLGASHMNDKAVRAINYESVDQYTGFYRFNFREGATFRFIAGGTNDNEAVLGSDISAPLNNRWVVQTSFNYLLTDQPNGSAGAREESWNVGINLVWVYGRMAKKGSLNPHAPLFPTADNGWLFIDRTP